MGAMTVLIGGQPAARMGDSTAHGGVIILGCPTVLIGSAGGGGGGGGGNGASQSRCNKAAKKAAAGGIRSAT
jgi:hypothetical protein